MNMNKLLVLSACFLLLVFAGFAPVQAQTDLNTRKALYFTHTKTDSIDLKNDVYVAGGATVALSAELRTTCDHNVCEFNVGIIATRTGTGALSSEIVVQVGGQSYARPIEFASSEKSKQLILPMKLKLGKNQITVTIDPNKKTAESDESNNSFSATVMVSWKRANPGEKN
jgi:hypothetical protein